MRTIIAGPRKGISYGVVEDMMDSCPWKVTEVVNGCASGVDRLGERWAEESMLPVQRFPADWARHGKAAGPRRNRQMAKYARSGFEVLFRAYTPDPCPGGLCAVDTGTPGTANMIRAARNMGLRIHRVDWAGRVLPEQTIFFDRVEVGQKGPLQGDS